METEDITAYEDRGSILFAAVGMKCVSCKNAKLTKLYDESDISLEQKYEAGKKKDAIVLVHGLLSSSNTF